MKTSITAPIGTRCIDKTYGEPYVITFLNGVTVFLEHAERKGSTRSVPYENFPLLFVIT